MGKKVTEFYPTGKRGLVKLMSMPMWHIVVYTDNWRYVTTFCFQFSHST